MFFSNGATCGDSQNPLEFVGKVLKERGLTMNLIPWKNKLQHRGGDGGAIASWPAMRHEMDRMFETFFREPFGIMDWAGWPQGQWMPPVDVAESENEMTVRAEIPGMDPKDLDVHVTGNQLVLSGEKKDTSENKGENYYCSETHYGSFHRSIPLPEDVDSEHVEAEYANGVLTLHMKKMQHAPAKRIEIQMK
jgi:HSP20 family protein